MNDDRLVGRMLGRRELMRLLAIGSAAAALPAGISNWETLLLAQSQKAATSQQGCVVRPEVEEGPYFVDHQLNRSDIRVEPTTGVSSPGVPLTLELAILQAGTGGCGPLSGATVDVWQCDANGVYSGVSGPGQRSAPGTQKFLRGVQITDSMGIAHFTTIYPGWYPGRTVHIHVKVRTTAAPTGAYEFTSQLFFDDALTDQIHAKSPYSARGRRTTTNQADGIFRGGGSQLILAPVKQNDGFTAKFGIGLDLSDAAVGRPDGNGGRGGPGGPGGGRGPGPGPRPPFPQISF